LPISVCVLLVPAVLPCGDFFDEGGLVGYPGENIPESMGEDLSESMGDNILEWVGDIIPEWMGGLLRNQQCGRHRQPL
jgi:hypothetical protein